MEKTEKEEAIYSLDNVHERNAWREESLSDQVKAIAEKIQANKRDELTPAERTMILNIDEVAFLASAIAKRPIAPRYIRLLRTSGRLKEAKKAGNTYLYTLEALLDVRFNDRQQ